MALNQEWLNQNSLRNYPFKEDALLIPVDSNGDLISDIRVPNYLVVDFIITMPGITLPKIYVSQLAFLGNLFTIIFKDDSGVQVASLSFDIAAHTKNATYNVVGSGTYDDVRGRVTIGDLTNLRDDFAEGLYNFTLATAETETITVRPALRSVRSIQLVNEGATSERIYGHVKFIAGTNTRLTYLPAYNTIRVDAIEGAGLNEECECDVDPWFRNVVRSINGIAIEDAVITGDGECVEVEVSGNKIIIKDTCTTPCCGCPELEYVTDSLKILETSLGNVDSYSNQLAERISNFVTNFVLTIGAGS